MEDKFLSVIIPVFNEAKTVVKAIELVLRVDTTPFRKQVIIVDDGPTDGTREILKEFRNKNPKICIIFMRKIWVKGRRYEQVLRSQMRMQ